ncbi:MAG: LruC domain-containing protein [Prevotella sp.]|nr:LruC domain-containing protein [Prevotella sp.]
MKMKNFNQSVFVIAAVMVFGTISCSKEIDFDKEKYTKYRKYVSPVDSVDQTHTWQLATSRSYQFTVNVNVGTQRLEVYSENPVTSTEAEMMGRAFVKDGQQVTLSVSVPSIATILYAALVDNDGTYTVTSFSPSERYVDFSDLIAKKEEPRLASPKIMTYTYCYEENYPEPGDYDFNDLVMRIGLERTGQRQVDIHVALAAVGASGQIAGALRLVGYRYMDIESVVAKDGKTLNVNVPKLSYGLILKDDILQEGRNGNGKKGYGEAVINLFLDAHWAMGDDIETINDEFTRKKYNVMRSFSDPYDQTYVKTVDFTVTFKSESGLNNLTQEMIDPFIITYYMANRIETHLDEYKKAQTLYNYEDNVDFKDIPWALRIPTRYFKYPLEGCQIGFRKRTEEGTAAMFGAYMTLGHSFGEWAEDHRNCLDWYLEEYATANQVW